MNWIEVVISDRKVPLSKSQEKDKMMGKKE